MIYLIVVLAFALRIIGLNQSLWLDEAIGALVVKNISFWDIVTKFAVADNHPPLYYLLLKLWTFFFGYSEISLRMPSVLFGVGIVCLVYKITKNKIATFLVATAPLLVYYSQEARMYMMAGFLATLAVYLFQRKKYFLFSISLVVLMFTDYVPVFLLPIFLIYAVLKKENIKETIISYLPLIIIGFFWLPVFLKQMNTGRVLVETLPAWQELSGGATFKQAILFWNKLIMGRISFYPKEVYFSLVSLSSIPFAIAFIKSLKKENLLFMLWFVVPLVFGFLISFIFPAFIYFRFIYLVPAFYILVGQTKNKTLISLMIIVNLIALNIYYFDENQKRENWREAISFVENNLKDNEIIVINYPSNFAPVEWYRKSNNYLNAADSISIKKVNKIDANYNGLYYFNYLEDLTDPKRIVRRKINDLGYKNKATYIFNGVGEIEYLIK